VLLRGNPFAPLIATALDLATGGSHELSLEATDGAVAFSGDGTFALVAEARRARVAGLLPAALATPFARFAACSARRAPLYRETRLRAGESGSPGEPLSLPALERWGSPSGVTLSPDARIGILGQRSADGASERLVRVHLGCR
jgi:hypothetical protein